MKSSFRIAVSFLFLKKCLYDSNVFVNQSINQSNFIKDLKTNKTKLKLIRPFYSS